MKVNKKDLELICGIFTGKFSNNFVWADKNYDFVKDQYPDNRNEINLKLNSKESTGAANYQFYVFINKNKTIRWLIPTDNKTPGFLKFYNINSLKSKLFALGINIAYKFNIQNLFSNGILNIRVPKNNSLNDLLKELKSHSYSIFLGTPSPCRKIIIECETIEKKNYFIKIPVNNSALLLLENERSLLRSNKENEYFIPGLHNSSKNILVQTSDFDYRNMERPKRFNSLLEKFITGNYLKSNIAVKLEESDFHVFIQKSIDTLKSQNLKPELESCFQQLLFLNNKIEKEDNYQFHLSHGDFTPWNMMINSNELYVYDWELSRDNTPLYFDFFHFYFQNGILQNKKNFQAILSDIKADLFKLNKYNESHKDLSRWQSYLSLYLCYISGYYLNVYQKQDVLHDQVYWLIDVWKDGLIWAGNLNQRSLGRIDFAKSIFDFLNSSDLKYGWLKSKQIKLEELSLFSDLDILIEKDSYPLIFEFIKNHAAVAGIKEVKLSFMSTIEIFLLSGSNFHIDLIWKFKRKTKIYLEAEKILNSTVTNSEGISLLNINHDFLYCLYFYQLNNEGIPQHYIKYFDENQKLILGYKYYRSHAFHKSNKKLAGIISDEIGQLKENHGFLKIKNMANYFIDTLIRIKKGKGFIISFSGVDGAGKSTVLNSTKKLFETKYRRKTVVLRHRPSFLPILSSFKYGKTEAEKKAGSQLPRQGNNTSGFSSFIRFIYYYCDYFFGQWLIYFMYVLKGYIVLYDRFYFDFINDPKRTNLTLSDRIPILLSKFIRKPDFNFLLVAPPNIILDRKQELSESAIKSLTSKYKNYFKKLADEKRGNFITVENIDLQNTLSLVENEIKTSISI